MSRSGFQISSLIKRNRFLCNYKPSPNTLSLERYYNKNDNNDEDQTTKEISERTSNTSTLEETKSSSSSKSILQKDSTDKKDLAKKKLFSLLSELTVEPSNGSKVESKLNLAKAVKRISKIERFASSKKLTPEEKLQVAVKDVAENISGDPDQTKFELNEKLSTLNLAHSPEVEVAGPEEVIPEVDEEMKENIMSSVKEIAATVTDSQAAVAIKSKLTQRLLRLSVEDNSDVLPKKSIDSLLKGMTVEKTDSEKLMQKARFTDKAEQFKRIAQRTRTAVNIFQSPPLDIFSLDEESKLDSKKTVWSNLEEKNLKLLVQFAPANGFEEMILWTEQGKHWKFPIDNETEMGDEENVGFNEHVFLEHHLHGFPTKGPVRQFMELVVVGLSKNPYITVERKIENIDWFRNYFKEKEEILKRYEAVG